MSKNKQNAQNVVVEPTIVEVPTVTVVEEVVAIVPETLVEKIARIKAEQEATLKFLMEQKKALDEQVKAMKAEELELKKQAKAQADIDRFEKLQAKLHRPEDSKRSAVINAIIDGAGSMEDVVLITGFDSKYVSDTVWGLEKSVGLR